MLVNITNVIWQYVVPKTSPTIPYNNDRKSFNIVTIMIIVVCKMTTIQVDEEIKRKLLEISGRLQIQLKKNITFNDTIQYLIDKHEGQRVLKDLTPLFGFLKTENQEARKLLTELRNKEEERLGSLAGKSRS